MSLSPYFQIFGIGPMNRKAPQQAARGIIMAYDGLILPL
ncbi:MAG: hypothetical protein ACI906_005092 [Candidatus Latescibacterota bacterium]|jgi:hypothetical protein